MIYTVYLLRLQSIGQMRWFLRFKRQPQFPLSPGLFYSYFLQTNIPRIYNACYHEKITYACIFAIVVAWDGLNLQCRSYLLIRTTIVSGIQNKSKIREKKGGYSNLIWHWKQHDPIIENVFKLYYFVLYQELPISLFHWTFRSMVKEAVKARWWMYL